MTYRRVLLLAEIGLDPRPAFGTVRALAPRAERLVVLACPPEILAAPRHGEPVPDDAGWLESARGTAAAAAASADVGFLPDLEPGAVDALVEADGIELVVAGPRPPGGLDVLAEVRRRRPVAVLWIPPSAAPGERPLAELLCFALGARARGAIAAFLRDHGEPTLKATVLSLARPPADELLSVLAALGVRAGVALAPPPAVAPWRVLDACVRERGIDLVVLARFVAPIVRSARWPVPVLVLPPPTPASRPVQRPLDVADPVDLGGALRVRVGTAYGVGRNPPIADQEVAFVSSGRVVATVTTRNGEAELTPTLAADALGMFRVGARPAVDPVSAVERYVTVIRPGSRPLVLFDAELPVAELSALAGARGVDLLAVRLRPVRSCHLVRARLRNAGLGARIVDASAVLDEGDAADVNEALDAVRLARVATRMHAAGFPVAAIVHCGALPPDARGFAVPHAGDVAAFARAVPAPARRQTSLSDRLDAMAGAPAIGGNRVEVELDNRTARRWLLEAAAGARRTLHLQTYMAADDDVGREVEAALAEAGSRGVAVRVLADSLHGLHGSLGLVNPLLERLSARPGVEVRVCRPLTGLPSVVDLKQRDHRKLVVADGRVALVGGRNVAHEYYRAFDEVEVAAATPWREVPWVDAGARVEGPAAAVLERSFREAWIAAGGAPFEIAEPVPAGTTTARVVVHRGLRDAATLETYLAIIDTARTRVDVVHGFPLLLEIQHALLRALRRGVRVRTLFGHVTPTHGGEPFEGSWATARTAATSMVHSRMDALVAAGAEGYKVAVRDMPGWAPDLGLVHPHVHAKAMGADGRVCAVGSANMDATGCYWESELLLVVEDEAAARAFEERVDALASKSVRVDRDDPEWQRIARRREWMRHWPGVLSL